MLWRDNKHVVVLSTDPRFKQEMQTVMRRDQNFKDTENRTKEVPQPIIVNRYISWMCGVDLAYVHFFIYQVIATYSTFVTFYKNASDVLE